MMKLPETAFVLPPLLATQLANGTPMYQRVTTALETAIAQGGLAPGAALPNEAALAKHYGVSIGTIRRAVENLINKGIVLRQQGRGTFIAEHTPARFLYQFFRIHPLGKYKIYPRVELLSFKKIVPPKSAALALKLRTGDAVYEVINRLWVQNHVVAVDTIYIEAKRFKGLSQALLSERPSTLYALYQSAFAVTVLSAQEHTRAVGAPHQMADYLGLSIGTPVLNVVRTALSFNHVPVEYRVSYVNTEQHHVVNTLDNAS